MSSGGDLVTFFSQQYWILPQLLIYLTGVVFSLATIKKHPMVSILAAAAFVVFGFNTLVGAGMSYWQFSSYRDDLNFESIGRVMKIWGALRTLTGTLAWAMLIGAIFSGRRSPKE